MGLQNAVKALLEDAKEVGHDVPHPSMTSTRLWVFIGFVLLILWRPELLRDAHAVTETGLRYVFWLAVVYIAGNSLTRLAQILVNGLNRREAMKLAWGDGKLDETEVAVIREPVAGTTPEKQ